MHDSHDHDYYAGKPPGHPVQPDEDNGPPGEFEIMSRALQELLIDKGLITAEDVRRRMEIFEQDYPYRGAKVIARAWADPAFKAQLLEDGKRACLAMGVDIEADRLIAVENTPQAHNLIVCTLCSCYPRALLGMPPTWYKSRNYRSRVVHEPRSVLREFGTELPDDVTVRVHDSNADMRYVVVPMRPAGTGDLSEHELAALITRDMLVGVTVPKPPQS
jgi:nitrile hydratase